MLAAIQIQNTAGSNGRAGATDKASMRREVKDERSERAKRVNPFRPKYIERTEQPTGKYKTKISSTIREVKQMSNFKVKTKYQNLLTVADRWKKQYCYLERWGFTAREQERELTHKSLVEILAGNHHADYKIYLTNKAIGNTSWTELRCSICSRKDCSSVVCFGVEHESYNEVCRDCLAHMFVKATDIEEEDFVGQAIQHKMRLDQEATKGEAVKSDANS